MLCVFFWQIDVDDNVAIFLATTVGVERNVSEVSGLRSVFVLRPDNAKLTNDEFIFDLQVTVGSLLQFITKLSVITALSNWDLVNLATHTALLARVRHLTLAWETVLHVLLLLDLFFHVSFLGVCSH